MEYFIIVSSCGNKTASVYVEASNLKVALEKSDKFNNFDNRVILNIIKIDKDSYEYLMSKRGEK